MGSDSQYSTEGIGNLVDEFINKAESSGYDVTEKSVSGIKEFDDGSCLYFTHYIDESGKECCDIKTDFDVRF